MKNYDNNDIESLANSVNKYTYLELSLISEGIAKRVENLKLDNEAFKNLKTIREYNRVKRLVMKRLQEVEEMRDCMNIMNKKEIINDYKIIFEQVNEIVEEAVEHGGDAGGAYNSNEEYLIKSLDDLIKIFLLSDKYEARVVKGYRQTIPQIVLKENIL